MAKNRGQNKKDKQWSTQLHTNLKIVEHEAYDKSGANSGALKGENSVSTSGTCRVNKVQ